MNRIVRNSLILGGILIASTSLIIYFKRQFKKLANSCYTIAGGVIHNISLEEVQLTILFKIKNTSDISLSLSNIEFNIFINNLFVTKILKKQKQTLLSNSEIIFSLDATFSPKNLLKSGISNITTLLVDKSKLIISVNGKFDADMGIVSMKNYKFEKKISLQELTSKKENKQKC